MKKDKKNYFSKVVTTMSLLFITTAFMHNNFSRSKCFLFVQKHKKVISNAYPIAHRAKRGARILISTCVESCCTRGDQGEKFSHCVSIFIYIFIYIYIHGFLSLKNAVCNLGDWYVVDQTLLRYRIEANRFWSRYFFPVWISPKLFTSFEH